MRSLVLSLLVLQLLLPGAFSDGEVEGENRKPKPVMCKNPKAKEGSAVLQGCSTATCAKVGKKGVWQQCPPLALETTVLENQRKIERNHELLKQILEILGQPNCCPTIQTTTWAPASTITEANTLIFLGPGDGTSGQSEVFSISENKDLFTQACEVPPYPITDIKNSVGFVYKDLIHICGGQRASTSDHINACFSLINSIWFKTTPMLTKRTAAAALRMQNGSVLVSGGFSGGWLQTSELLTGSTWTPSIQLPSAMIGHCMLLLSTGELFLHGYPGFTYISKDHASWEKVMSSKSKEAYAACTEVIINSDQQVWIGLRGSTEICQLVDGTWTWTDGPDLPNYCYGPDAKFVSYEGKLFYACGSDKNIYQLKDNWQTQQDAWTKIGDMSEKRRYFPALLITEDVCKGKPSNQGEV